MEFMQSVKLTPGEISEIKRALSIIEDLYTTVENGQELVFSSGETCTEKVISNCYDFLVLLIERGGDPMRIEDRKPACN